MKLKKRKICLQEEDIQGSGYDNPYVSPSPILVADPVGQVTAHVTVLSIHLGDLGAAPRSWSCITT